MNWSTINSLFAYFLILYITEVGVGVMLCNSCPTKVSKRKAYLIATLVSLYIPLITVFSAHYIGGGTIQETTEILLFNKGVLVLGEALKLIFIILVLDVKWYRIYGLTIVLSIFNTIPAVWFTETHAAYDSNGYVHMYPVTLASLSQYLLMLLLAFSILGIYQGLAIVLKKWNPRYRVPKPVWCVIYGAWFYMLLTITKNYQSRDIDKEVPLRTAGNVYEVIILFIVVVASMIIGIYNRERKMLIKEKAMLLDRTELQYQSYEVLNQKETEIRKLYHDMENHMHTIQYLVVDGESDKAKEYVAELTDKLKGLRYKSYCTNPIIDTVLRQKMNQADECGITCELDIQIPRDLKIKDIDLVSVFSNLLDNAIESCQRNEETENFIRVNTAVTGDYLAVKVVNSKKAGKIPGQVSFATSKIDKVMHGYGLRIVDEIVARYEGFKELKAEEEQFSVLVMMHI